MRQIVISLAALLILPACGMAPTTVAPMASQPTVAALAQPEGTSHYYRLDEIKGIGPVYRSKLQAVGIFGTQNLLQKLATRKQRADVSAQTGISTKLLLRWANKADLMRITGIGPQASDLLEAISVDTVPELAQRKAAALYPKMEFANKIAGKFMGQLPTQAAVQKWIDTAKTMDRVLQY